MTTRKLRWGVLGVAKINDRVLPSFAQTTHAVLAAIASRSLEKAQHAAKAAGIPKAHGSYEALLDDPDVDAVYIPLPNHLHAEWTRKAAERGKHILCEKPLTPTHVEAAELVAFCKARGVQLMDGFMWPHHPRTAKIRQLLDSGAIGRVERVTAAFTFPLPPDPANIRLQPQTGGGSLLDVGCYPVYGIRWAFGAEPVKAYANARYRHGVDVEMSGLVALSDGRMGTFDCGFTFPYRAWMEITGSEGILHVPNMWVPDAKAEFTVRRADGAPQVFTVEGHDQIASMLDDFSGAVLRGEPVQPDPEQAVRSLRVMDALAKSARQGREVAVL
jgi:predicted dehydrogenase